MRKFSRQPDDTAYDESCPLKYHKLSPHLLLTIPLHIQQNKTLMQIRKQHKINLTNNLLIMSEENESMNEVVPKITGRNLSIVAALFLATSVLSSWGSVLSVDSTGAETIVDVSGLSGNDGFLLLALAIVVLVVLSLRTLPFWMPLIIGVGALFFSIRDFLAMSEAMQDLNGELGIGIYLTIAASLGIILGSVVQYIQEKKKKRRK